MEKGRFYQIGVSFVRVGQCQYLPDEHRQVHSAHSIDSVCPRFDYEVGICADKKRTVQNDFRVFQNGMCVSYRGVIANRINNVCVRIFCFEQPAQCVSAYYFRHRYGGKNSGVPYYRNDCLQKNTKIITAA